MVEGARLESEYTPKAYRGFESLPLRQAPPATVSTRTGLALCRGIGSLFRLKPYLVALLRRLFGRCGWHFCRQSLCV